MEVHHFIPSHLSPSCDLFEKSSSLIFLGYWKVDVRCKKKKAFLQFALSMTRMENVLPTSPKPFCARALYIHTQVLFNWNKLKIAIFIQTCSHYQHNILAKIEKMSMKSVSLVIPIFVILCVLRFYLALLHTTKWVLAWQENYLQINKITI